MDSHRRTAVNELTTPVRNFTDVSEQVSHLNGHKPPAMEAAAFHAASQRILESINTVIDG
ncbi:MAG TPA: ATPase, partial [Arthrobacter bacterium]|nr:ATPase [Arthrobacter sp.]